jgi:hypothetical protein
MLYPSVLGFDSSLILGATRVVGASTALPVAKHIDDGVRRRVFVAAWAMGLHSIAMAPAHAITALYVVCMKDWLKVFRIHAWRDSALVIYLHSWRNRPIVKLIADSMSQQCCATSPSRCDEAVAARLPGSHPHPARFRLQDLGPEAICNWNGVLHGNSIVGVI